MDIIVSMYVGVNASVLDTNQACVAHHQCNVMLTIIPCIPQKGFLLAKVVFWLNEVLFVQIVLVV